MRARAPLDIIWRTSTPDAELSFSVLRRESDGFYCDVSQVIRHAEHHVTTRFGAGEVEHRLLPDGEGGQLMTIHRWDRSLSISPEALAEKANGWLSSVKAAAEALARRR
ncbi:MAG TPA: hypothetical protein VHZ96_14105 [Frankiaceae bacterium]|nr:hypothetical protein [Frankiaceae bacterium]